MLQTGTPWRVKDTAIHNHHKPGLSTETPDSGHPLAQPRDPPFPPTTHRLSPTSSPWTSTLLSLFHVSEVSHPPHSCSAFSGLSLEGTQAGRSPLTPETRLVPSHRLPGHPEYHSSLLLSLFTGCGCLLQPPRCLAFGLGQLRPLH